MIYAAALCAAGTLTAAVSHAAAGAENARPLSAAQQHLIAKGIGTLGRPAERRMARAWSPAKQVAEFICRPAALRTLRRGDRSIDRVFLGTDAPDTLRLDSADRLEGQGQARSRVGWREFDFVCDMDRATGKVRAFTTTDR